MSMVNWHMQVSTAVSSTASFLKRRGEMQSGPAASLASDLEHLETYHFNQYNGCQGGVISRGDWDYTLVKGVEYIHVGVLMVEDLSFSMGV